MLLFPGEEDLYEDLEGWRILPAGRELLVICPGTCRREERPLSCRIFPLLPLPGETGIRVQTDERARAVCPLARQGKRSMDPDYSALVRAGMSHRKIKTDLINKYKDQANQIIDRYKNQMRDSLAE